MLIILILGIKFDKYAWLFNTSWTVAKIKISQPER